MPPNGTRLNLGARPTLGFAGQQAAQVAANPQPAAAGQVPQRAVDFTTPALSGAPGLESPQTPQTPADPIESTKAMLNLLARGLPAGSFPSGKLSGELGLAEITRMQADADTIGLDQSAKDLLGARADEIKGEIVKQKFREIQALVEGASQQPAVRETIIAAAGPDGKFSVDEFKILLQGFNGTPLEVGPDLIEALDTNPNLLPDFVEAPAPEAPPPTPAQGRVGKEKRSTTTDFNLAVRIRGLGKTVSPDIVGQEAADRANALTPEEADQLAAGTEPAKRRLAAKNELLTETAQIENIGNLLGKARTIKSATGVAGFIVDTVGGLLGQLSPDLEDAFAGLFGDSSPEEVAAFRTQAQNVIAANIKTVAGDDSGRFTDRERQITESALAVTKPGASTAQITAAVGEILMLKIEMKELARVKAGIQIRFDLDSDRGIDDFIQKMYDLNMSEDQVRDIFFRLKSIRDEIGSIMERK